MPNVLLDFIDIQFFRDKYTSFTIDIIEDATLLMYINLAKLTVNICSYGVPSKNKDGSSVIEMAILELTAHYSELYAYYKKLDVGDSAGGDDMMSSNSDMSTSWSISGVYHERILSSPYNQTPYGRNFLLFKKTFALPCYISSSNWC